MRGEGSENGFRCFVLFVSDGVLGGWTAVCFPVRGLSTKVIPVEGSGFTRN